MHQVLRRIVPILCFGLAALAASSAEAGFIASTTGAIDVISPPTTATALISNSYQAWEESAGTLSGALQVNQLGQTGSFDGLTNYSSLSGTLASGTKFDSVMIQLNPGDVAKAQAPIATITFTGKIIGLALFGPTLDASDVYGNPSTTNPHGLPTLLTQGRGMDLLHNDRFSITNNGLTLCLQLTAGFRELDEIRVFTAQAATAVPEPMSLTIWSSLGLVLVLRKQRFWRRKPLGTV